MSWWVCARGAWGREAPASEYKRTISAVHLPEAVSLIKTQLVFFFEARPGAPQHPSQPRHQRTSLASFSARTPFNRERFCFKTRRFWESSHWTDWVTDISWPDSSQCCGKYGIKLLNNLSLFSFIVDQSLCEILGTYSWIALMRKKWSLIDFPYRVMPRSIVN